MLFAAPARR